MEVRAVEVTNRRIGDAPILPALLPQIPTIIRSRRPPPMAHMTGVPADTPSPCEAPRRSSTRRNAKPWKKDSPGARGRNDDLRAIRRFDRTL